MKPKRVILCPNPYRDSELKVCRQSRDMLESLGMQTSVCLPFQREGYGEELGLSMRPLQQEIRQADLLIAFGGDGTILHLARTVALHSVPVLGVNLGSLGFMSELEVNELDRLRDLAQGRFTVESRMMLDVSVLREGRQVYNNIALNDAVVSKGSIARVVRLDIFTEEGRLTKVGGDGIIVSTPTGSTGREQIKLVSRISPVKGTAIAGGVPHGKGEYLECPLYKSGHYPPDVRNIGENGIFQRKCTGAFHGNRQLFWYDAGFHEREQALRSRA